MKQKSVVKRAPKRALYDRDAINAILDSMYLCHVAFIQDGYPVVIPTMYGRRDDALYIHGASVSRLITSLEQGIPVCVSVAAIDALVLARSAFHHSMNYRSVVVFGTGVLVPEHEKLEALKIISDHALPGRWDEVRLPSAIELKATKVIRISMDDVSGKSRTGGPIDEPEDYSLDVWAGVLPLKHEYGAPVPDAVLNPEAPLPASVMKKMHDFPSAGAV